MAMLQQRPQVTLSHRRHPDRRKSIVHQQAQQQERIPTIILLLTWFLRPNLAWVSDQALDS